MTPLQIISAVCDAANVTTDRLLSRDRHQNISDARTIAAHELYLYGYTTIAIGIFLQRHPSTITAALQRFTTLYLHNRYFHQLADKAHNLIEKL